MAFTLHWSNHAYGCTDTENFGGNRTRPENSVEPVLSLQKDVILPRVLGHFGGGTDDGEIDDRLYGCRGHGLDQEFPLKPTSDVCVPLVLCQGNNKNTKDVCAEPVLNWEEYVLSSKGYSEPKGLKHVRINVEEELSRRTEGGSNRTPRRPSKSVKGGKVAEIPVRRVEGTWNFSYTNRGACDVLKNKHGAYEVLVGYGEALRVVTLKEDPGDSRCRFRVKKVKDEEETGHRGVIRQIQCIESGNLAIVRRPTRISIYAVDKKPAKLDTLRPVYHGKDKSFLTFDCNPHNCNELVTVDSDHEVRLHNLVKGESELLFTMKKDKLDCIWPNGPSEFTLNASSSIRYLNHPSLMLAQRGSKVALFDKRSNLLDDLQVQNPRNLFNIKEDTVSFSDYYRGCKDGSSLRPETISSVTPSVNPNYYHIGTSHRVFTMDWRVPGNPALRYSHGMNSSLTYLQSVMFDDHEVVIGGSQRTNETFAAVLDHGHATCRQERFGCDAVNPILASFPHHLLSTNESYEAQTDFLSWSYERKLMQNRYEAWCSGLTTIGTSRNSFSAGASLSVFTTNTFGDVFYQEWKHIHEKEPEAPNHLIEDSIFSSVDEALRNSLFVSKQSSGSKTRDIGQSPSDFSLVVEDVAASVSGVLDIRSKPFSAFERTKDVEPVQSVSFISSDMRCCRGPLAEKLYQAWEENLEELPDGISDTQDDTGHMSEHEEPSRTLTSEGIEIPVDVEIKEEPQDDEDSDIEVIQPEPKVESHAEELVLSDSEFYGIPGLSSISLTNVVLNENNAADEDNDENVSNYAEPGPSSSISQTSMHYYRTNSTKDHRRSLRSQSLSSQPVKRRAGFK